LGEIVLGLIVTTFFRNDRTSNRLGILVTADRPLGDRLVVVISTTVSPSSVLS